MTPPLFSFKDEIQERRGESPDAPADILLSKTPNDVKQT